MKKDKKKATSLLLILFVFLVGADIRDVQAIPNPVDNILNWQKATSQNDPEAQYKLGLLFVRTNKLEEAGKWFRKAAYQNHSGAQYNLGILLEEGGKREEAKIWWKKAANQNYPAAQNTLA